MKVHSTLSLAAALLVTTVSWACNSSMTPTAPTQQAGSPPPNLPPSPSRVDPSGPTGSYTLMLTASPSCAAVTDAVSGTALQFPDSVRVRRYEAEFADGSAILMAADGTENRVRIGGFDNYINPGPLMTLAGAELTIIVPPADGGGYIKTHPTCAGGDYWWEVLNDTAGDNEAFESCGTWRGSAQNPDRIEGTISGSFGYYRGVGPGWRTHLFCSAPDHHFTLTKR